MTTPAVPARARVAWGRAACIGLLAVALPAAASAKVKERMGFGATVTVSADGRVSVGEVEGVQGPLAGVVRDAVAGMDFVPGRVGGAPVDSTVLVDGDVVLDPVDGEYDVILARFETQPRLRAWRPADFPVAELREREDGLVSLVLQVGADGKVTGSDVLSSDGNGFTEAARAAAADWRFEPAGVPFEVGAAFWFHGNWSYPRVPDVPCTVPARMAHLRGDDGCLRISETTGDIVIRGSGGPYTEVVVRTPAPPSAGGRRFLPAD